MDFLLTESPQPAAAGAQGPHAAIAWLRARLMDLLGLSEDELCPICSDTRRDQRCVCVVEHVPDLVAIERSGSWRSVYHVLHGKLSPLHGVGPEDLNLGGLLSRVQAGEVDELVLALPNDVEGEATCHYIQEHLPPERGVRVTRIGFGIPSGGGVLYADSVTLRSALEGRRNFN